MQLLACWARRREHQVIVLRSVRRRPLLGQHPGQLGRQRHLAPAGAPAGDLAVHDPQGLYVADGAAAPSPLGVNPQPTIMALVTPLAFRVLGRGDRGLRTSLGDPPWWRPI